MPTNSWIKHFNAWHENNCWCKCVIGFGCKLSSTVHGMPWICRLGWHSGKLWCISFGLIVTAHFKMQSAHCYTQIIPNLCFFLAILFAFHSWRMERLPGAQPNDVENFTWDLHSKLFIKKPKKASGIVRGCRYMDAAQFFILYMKLFLTAMKSKFSSWILTGNFYCAFIKGMHTYLTTRGMRKKTKLFCSSRDF